jgi:hypothetical protein
LELFLFYRSFSVILGSEECVLELRERFMRESGVTQASRRISIGIREGKHMKKAVEVIEKKIS